MNKQQAQNLIKETFENPFDKGRFTGFIKNLLNQIEDAPFTYQGNYIPDAYKPYISSLERIGKYSDDQHKIDILCVQLKKETSLERARTMQRNFIAWYLNGSRGGEMKDAALVAFVSPGEVDWRFSLVKMDYRFEESKTSKIKVKEEFTPARRWSFLVGSNEASHTAQTQFVRILGDDEHDPTLGELEEAFYIETVTKEFFLKYRELFIRTKEALDKVVESDAKVKANFEAKSVDTVNFSKKLLGQIVFLYFLQKKGWFGVERDAEWGTGSKHFLRQLFAGKHGEYNNFFNDILEPLFYEALRRPRDDEYYSRFNCKIPFLNGGLFDPIHDYDWVHTDIIIPNELFSNNVKTKEGDTGNGILDIFDRFNFTVKEDEPLEKEVAIDPELLGKAYEKFNAIRPDNYAEYKAALKSGKKGAENKFNKKFGVYYTPREIVHYMCQQSLINYLCNVTQASSLRLSEQEAKQEDYRQDTCDTIMYYDPDAPTEKKRRNLPHWQQKGTAYFVTFRLFDSIPKQIAEDIKREREQWLKSNNISTPSEVKKLSHHKRIEYYRLFSKRYNELLDNGYGCCVLAKPECKKIVERALKHFDGDRYDLEKHVVMPNHVHGIVIPKENWTLSKITHSWKSFTSNEINKILGREGQLWMPESFDHIIRSPVQFDKIRKYIEDNPKVTQVFKVAQTSQPESHRQDACATISKEDIETLIKFGEQVGENEAVVQSKGRETRDYSYKLPESIRKNAEQIDQALANITVCDPAIGSGAFPVGMMHEIVKTRNVLTNVIQPSSVSQASSLSMKGHRQDARATYQFKRECIEKSLYGVDIDPGAVEIAKLRLWLSLVVDEEDIRRIKPLPNLDYKIVCGNSLLGVEKDLFNNELFAELERMKPLYFDETNPTKKQEYKKQIDALISQITNGHQEFDFEVYFSEMFHEKGGFDVVIANPPYVRQEEITSLKPTLQSEYLSYDGRADLFVYFYEIGVNSLREGGVLTFISSNKWLRAKYGGPLRHFLTKHCLPNIMLDFGELPVFSAATFPMIFVGQKGQGSSCRFAQITSLDPPYPDFGQVLSNYDHAIAANQLGAGAWNFLNRSEAAVLSKISSLRNTIPSESIMAGIKTGLNRSFWIDAAVRNALVDNDKGCMSFIKPLLVGDDIRAWRTKPTSKWIIYTPIGTDLSSLGPIKIHLQRWKDRLEQRALSQAWYELQQGQQRYCGLFEHPKIVYPDIAKEPRFTLDDRGHYIDMTAFAIASADKSLLAVLNSKTVWFFLKRTAAVLGDPDKGGRLRLKRQYLEKVPVPTIPPRERKMLESLVDRILNAKQGNSAVNTSALEREIDQMVYQLYGLTEEEITVVEEQN